MLGELRHDDHAVRAACRWVGRIEGVVGVVPARRADGAVEVLVVPGTPTASVPGECRGVPVVVREARGVWSFRAEVEGPRA